ncbi:MAG: hypothetical protein HUU38_16330 [Anaerolineales bacterium]|nr:hypothetical protein [Anaerolineales bacterium]
MEKKNLLIILTSCMGCIMICIGLMLAPIIDSRIDRKIEDQIYRERLGIDADEGNLLSYMNANLVGQSYADVLSTLAEWGEVTVSYCSVGNPHRCEIKVAKFLETDNSYDFVMFFKDDFLTSVKIEYS